MSAFGTYLLQTFVMLLLIGGLAVLVLWGARRVGIGRPIGSMRMIGRLPLDARRSVYLVRIGRSVLVLGASEAGLTKLAELDAADVPEQPEPPVASFSQVWARMRSGPGSAQEAQPENPPASTPVDDGRNP